MKRLLLPFVITAALLAAGLAAALVIAPAAKAWGPGDLPPGFTVNHTVDASYTGPNSISPCPSWYTIAGGGAVSPIFCENSPTFQADFDAWVNGHYTAPPATSAPPTTSAATTAPATTSDPATTDPATTDAAPAVTQTSPATPAPTPTCDLQCQIVDLQAQIDALRGQLGRLVQILETWPSIDPGILSELMGLQP